MEDLAVSIMSLSRSAPLYRFFDVPAWEEYCLHEDISGGLELAAAGAKSVGDNNNNIATQLLRGGPQLPLKLPPWLQHPADWSAAFSATTSPTPQAQLCMVPSWSPFTSSTRHRDFDPFAAALDKVCRDGAAPLASASRPMRRARSLSSLRGAQTAATNLNISRLAKKASRRPPQRSTGRRGVKRLLCWAPTASSAAAPAPGKDGVASYRRPSLLVCFGF
ncbi:hypothetical protein CFC21_093900 [Triticum aestivum]|uniref:Uncharacterized protein n=1 Tax=Triticum aestivum TaxID=4565 RepID=A0A9R1LLZ3_WHEAT|nr:hypothetical protein CFC21_093900 [Triticum aestivum]